MPHRASVGSSGPGGSCRPSVSATATMVWPIQACSVTSAATQTSLANIQPVKTSRRKISEVPVATVRTAAGVASQVNP